MGSQTGRIIPTPKAFPLGGRCPSAHTGADEGAILYPTFPCRNKKRGAPACRLNGIFLLLRWATRSPPHPSPSVTASPQGEASGLCSPTQKKRPKSGHVHGLRNRRNIASLRPTTPKPASGNERAIKKGGPGGLPPALFLPISRGRITIGSATAEEKGPQEGSNLVE